VPRPHTGHTSPVNGMVVADGGNAASQMESHSSVLRNALNTSPANAMGDSNYGNANSLSSVLQKFVTVINTVLY